jgi:hypothetical protein
MRDRLEPAVDDLRKEFARFQRTIERSEMANDGIRAVNEFNRARAVVMATQARRTDGSAI